MPAVPQEKALGTVNERLLNEFRALGGKFENILPFGGISQAIEAIEDHETTLLRATNPAFDFYFQLKVRQFETAPPQEFLTKLLDKARQESLIDEKKHGTYLTLSFLLVELYGNHVQQGYLEKYYFNEPRLKDTYANLRAYSISSRRSS